MSEKSEKEINLLELLGLIFDRIKLFLSKTVQFLSYLIGHSYRYKWLIMIVVFLSLIVGQYHARKSNRYYKAGAYVSVNGSNVNEIKAIISQLENANPLEEKLSLSTKLNIDDSIARSIREIRSFYVIDYNRDSIPNVIDFKNSHSKRDTVNVYHTRVFYLQVKTFSIDNLPIIEQSIKNFVNNNAFVRQKFDAEIMNFKSEIDICNRELQRIDSLAKVSYFKDEQSNIKLENNKLIVGEQRKQLFYDDMFELQKRKRKAELELAQFVEPVVIPGGLVVNPKAVNNRVDNAIVSGLIGLALALWLSFLLRYTHNVISWLDKKSKTEE